MHSISEAISSTLFNLLIAWRKTGYGEWMLWMVGNEFYYVETMKMECNWKSNWIVSSMETKKLTKPPRKLVDNSSLFLKTNNIILKIFYILWITVLDNYSSIFSSILLYFRILDSCMIFMVFECNFTYWHIYIHIFIQDKMTYLYKW